MAVDRQQALGGEEFILDILRLRCHLDIQPQVLSQQPDVQVWSW